MIKKQIRSGLISFATLCLIFGIAFLIIAYGKGYRIDFRRNTFKPTGLLSATSDPIAAQVYINGSLKTATNNSINIDPGFYTVRIAKESYIAWQKNIRVQGEIVTRADAFLFPTNPRLSPLTTTGVERPVLSPDGTKIAYLIPKSTSEYAVHPDRIGLWVLELADKPLGRNRDPYQISSLDGGLDMAKAGILWSPDSSQILVSDTVRSRLYPSAKLPQYADVSGTQEDALFREWVVQSRNKDLQKLGSFKPEIVSVATSSAAIIAFSPDETKLLYEATASAVLPRAIDPPLIGANSTEESRAIEAGKLYVYDSHEDKNYYIEDSKTIRHEDGKKKTEKNVLSSDNLTVLPSPIQWFPTNRHLILTADGKIDVMEYDRTNWVTIYSGPFDRKFIAPWPNSSRIVILTNLNPGASTLPNLYTVDLR